MHLLTLQKLVEEFNPAVVVIDPLTNLISIGSQTEVKSMLVRLIDFLKMKQVTTLFTSLTSGGDAELNSEVGISSLMDTWLLVRNLETSGERNRGLYVLKSRGMAHSTQVREFCLTDHGIDLVDVYLGPEGVLTGSARIAQEGRERMAAQQRQAETRRRQAEVERKRQMIASQIAALQAEIAAEEEQLQLDLAQEEAEQRQQVEERSKISHVRQASAATVTTGNGARQKQEKV
jgi:circadian clock protein KaiC